jgi:hypothetical protein
MRPWVPTLLRLSGRWGERWPPGCWRAGSQDATPPRNPRPPIIVVPSRRRRAWNAGRSPWEAARGAMAGAERNRAGREGPDSGRALGCTATVGAGGLAPAGAGFPPRRRSRGAAAPCRRSRRPEGGSARPRPPPACPCISARRPRVRWRGDPGGRGPQAHAARGSPRATTSPGRQRARGRTDVRGHRNGAVGVHRRPAARVPWVGDARRSSSRNGSLRARGRSQGGKAGRSADPRGLLRSGRGTEGAPARLRRGRAPRGTATRTGA